MDGPHLNHFLSRNNNDAAHNQLFFDNARLATVPRTSIGGYPTDRRSGPDHSIPPTPPNV
jgi:hypothetical protein